MCSHEGIKVLNSHIFSKSEKKDQKREVKGRERKDFKKNGKMQSDQVQMTLTVVA